VNVKTLAQGGAVYGPLAADLASAAAMNMMPIVQIWFAFLVLIGLWLTFVGRRG